MKIGATDAHGGEVEGYKKDTSEFFSKNFLFTQERSNPFRILSDHGPPPPKNFGKNITDPVPWIFNSCASTYGVVVKITVSNVWRLIAFKATISNVWIEDCL